MKQNIPDYLFLHFYDKKLECFFFKKFLIFFCHCLDYQNYTFIENIFIRRLFLILNFYVFSKESDSMDW